MADLLGVLVMATLPSFSPAVVQGLEMAVAGGCHQAEAEYRPVELKVGLGPRRVTVRLHQEPIVRFGLHFDARGRPDLKPLAAEFARVRQAFPELTTVQLEVAEDVELDLLIAVADLCIGAGLPSIHVGADTAEDP